MTRLRTIHRLAYGQGLLAAAALALLAGPAQPARAEGFGAMGWTTTMRRAPPRPAASPRDVAPALQSAGAAFAERTGLHLRDEAEPISRRRLIIARRALQPGAAHGPYLGAGLASAPAGEEGGPQAALVGGASAPFVQDGAVFGEAQRREGLSGGETVFWFGVRTGR